MEDGEKKEKLVIYWGELHCCVFYCLVTEERANLLRWAWGGEELASSLNCVST